MNKNYQEVNRILYLFRIRLINNNKQKRNCLLVTSLHNSKHSQRYIIGKKKKTRRNINYAMVVV